MNWQLLASTDDERFYRGAVFRFPAKYPFEDTVDFMIIEDTHSSIGLKLICSTGYHAGQTELVLPAESKHKDGGLSVQWLIENWEKWVYPKCSMKEVRFVENYWPEIGEIT